MNVALVRGMAFRCALLLLVSACAVAGMRQAHSQTLSLSGSVRAGDLWCLPATDAPDSYYYVPNGAAIDTDDAGSPTFSFLRYAYGEAGRATGTDQLIADGGGLVHFLIVLQTPEDRVETARSELRGVTGNPDAELRGPLVFSEGRFTLISSVLNQARNESETKILAAGRAPLLEGNQLAFSFDLSTTDATLFLESLQTATPDASVVFEMSFAAVTPAFDGKLTVDWTELSKHRSFKAGADVYFLSAEVEDVLDEITRSQAVRIESRGSDAKSEAMLAHAHEQLTNLLFRPVSGASMPETEQAGLAEVVAAISKSAERAVIQASGAPAISASVGYRIKELKSEGRSVIELTHSEIVQRRATIVMNVSDLYQRWGTDTAHFRVVNLEDPVFRQREIRVLLDGSLQEDFANYINHVTVTVKKDHAGGSQTVREVQYDRRAFDDGELERQLVYGWHDDADPLDWRNYEYRARWSFFGGGTFDTGWLDAQDSKINLFAPYQRQSLKLLGQWAALEQAGVRSVDVAVRYPFFGNTKTQRLAFQAEESFASQGIEMILPAGTREYDYDIQWTLAGGEIVAQSGRDWRQHLVVDELPPR